MANYNNNDRNKGGYFNQYVNFDQFLMQHNMNNWSPSRVPPSGNGFMASPAYASPTPTNAFQTFNGGGGRGSYHGGPFYFQPQSANSNNTFSPAPSSPSSNWLQNSNLTATASEFIPQQISSVTSNLALTANANEFIPRNHQSNVKQHTTEAKPTVTLATAAAAASSLSLAPTLNSSVSCDNNSKVGCVTNTDSVIEALSNTHISNSKQAEESKTLNSSGGAIKKIRSQDYRNDSRDRHSNGNLYTGKRQMERYDDYRRRKNDNGRQNSGRATKFDTNRNYRNKTENADEDSPTNNYKIRYHNNRFNKGSNSQLNERTNGTNGTNGTNNSCNGRAGGDGGNENTTENGHTSINKTTQNWNRRKERNEAKDMHRPRYDDRSHRNGKPNVGSSGGGGGGNGGMKFDSANCSQREKLTREIDGGRLECLVCYDKIKPYSAIWSCANCFHIMHLNCIIKWAESSKSEEGWRCCACQNISKSLPREYYCFCGKTKNPQYNRNDMAHSCGEVCSRIDRENCPHPCTQLCHPGPCPQCQVMVSRECCCGKTKKMYACNQKVEFKCDQCCDKDLNCKVHKCEKSCHSGDCDNCAEEIEQTCYCQSENRIVPCTKENEATLTYSCGRPCDKQLKCGNHKCKNVCHDGDCADCELLPETVKTCPCGKLQIQKDQRISCSDPIPLCTATCKKRLTCGQPNNPHTCAAKCHYGTCPPCNKQTAVKCRCGHMDQAIKCNQLSTRADDARCKKKCTKKRNCGKHKCNQECCIDIDHECPIKCTYTLSCGKHKCESTCHKGRCLPCYRSSFDELYCECGANVIYPPVPCGTKRPACDRPCSRQHPCDHEITHNCHSAQNCPPCMAFTKKSCHGKHEQRNIIPCSQKDFSCGLPCNKPLKCGRHKCIKICHPAPCETEADVCKQNCPKPRIMCPHACNAPCHLDTPCPDTLCRELIEVSCQCGLRKQKRTCHEFSSDYRKIATAQLASSMDQMQNGGSVELSDVLGPIKMTNNKTLECNEECRVAERNRRLAIGLQIRNPDLPSKLQPKYSDFIRGWAKKDPKLVAMIHDKLTDLVKLAKDSKQKSRSFSFPTMNREKRQLVHEMCSMFGAESKAYDAEPNRNVVATATRATSWLPSVSIMEMLARENGQRRVIVPNMNAWGIKR